ncbi:MAG: class I SAM-dependent methyltransferase [Bacteroidales bacterium]|nr:class I SAM-dependent methyltransferase [Bacteroidales bacterium]
MESSLDKYLREHSTLPSPALEWIQKQTHIRTNFPRMLSGPVQGELLKMLVSLTGAKRILEIGSFTGYSTVCLALGGGEDCIVDALEINDELEELMREGWDKAGVSGRIRLHLGDACETLGRLAGEPGREYDFVFMDANKREYCKYYELLMPLLRPGGLLVADDVLWDGKVYADSVPSDAQTQGLLEFNRRVAEDPGVETVMLPLRDGLLLIRKL